MPINVKVTAYKPDANQPFFETEATDFDSRRRDNDKIFLVVMPNGDRIFMHITPDELRKEEVSADVKRQVRIALDRLIQDKEK